MSDGTSLSQVLQSFVTFGAKLGQPAPILVQGSQVQSIPPETLVLPPKTAISATVTVVNANATIVLSTEQGQVEVQLPEKAAAKLSQGQSIELQVLNAKPDQIQLQLKPIVQRVQNQQQVQSILLPQDQTNIRTQNVQPTPISVQPRAVQPEQVLAQILGTQNPAPLQTETTIRLLPVNNLPNLPLNTGAGVQILPQALTPNVDIASSQNFVKGQEATQINPVQNLITTQNLIAREQPVFQSVVQQAPQFPIVFSVLNEAPEPFITQVVEPRILPRVANPVVSLVESFVPPKIDLISSSAQILVQPKPDLQIGQEVSLRQLENPPEAQTLRLNVREILPNPITLPQSETPTPQPQIQIDQLVGRVVGFTENQFPVVQLFNPASEEVGRYALNFPANNVQVGTPIIFNTVGAQSIVPPPQQSFQAFGQSTWQGLDQILKQILLQPPQAAQAAQQSIIPSVPQASTPPQMAASTLFFIAAAVSGDVKNWLPQKAIEALDKAKISTEKLSSDMGQMRTRMSDVAPSDWRGVSIPLLTQEQITRVDFFWREESGAEQQDKDKGTRFIMDLNLSRMGDVQVDGLVRDKRLDVVLRTERELAAPMRQQLRQLYSDAIYSSDYEGDISFRGNPEDMLEIHQGY